MREEGDYDDFQSAFMCLPAVPRKYEHANEHFLRLRHMNLHVIVVVAGSGPNTGQVSKMGEMAKQWLTQRRLIWIFFFFFWIVALCCTRCKPTTEVSMDYTVPGERLCYCTSMGLPEVQCRPETLNVTVMDQFYKHVLLHFSPHNEFCWFSFFFSFFSFQVKVKGVFSERSHSKL